MKTMLALALELGVPKLKVYRCIKRFSIETVQRNGVIYLDDTAESKVKSALEGSSPFLSDTGDTVQTISDETVSDTALIHLIQSQLEMKDAQITALMAELAIEREHNREKDKILLDTLGKLAQSQAALSTGQAAEKQKALAETIISAQRPRLLDAVTTWFRPKKKRFDFSKREEPLNHD